MVLEPAEIGLAQGNPAGVEALQDPDERRRMSAPAVRLFLKLADAWGLNVAQRRTLLGEISKQTYYNWQRGIVAALSRDQLERISLLLGVFKGLKLVFVSDENALRWLKSSNNDFEFAGMSPLDRMMNGGINDLYAVRRYVDAWRGVR